MRLGREVGLGSGHIVLDGDSAPLPKGTQPSPIFGLCLLWPSSWMDQDVTWWGGKALPKPDCVSLGPSSPSPKGHSPHLIFGPCLLWPNGRPCTCYDEFCTRTLILTVWIFRPSGALVGNVLYFIDSLMHKTTLDRCSVSRCYHLVFVSAALFC